MNQHDRCETCRREVGDQEITLSLIRQCGGQPDWNDPALHMSREDLHTYCVDDGEALGAEEFHKYGIEPFAVDSGPDMPTHCCRCKAHALDPIFWAVVMQTTHIEAVDTPYLEFSAPICDGCADTVRDIGRALRGLRACHRGCGPLRRWPSNHTTGELGAGSWLFLSLMVRLSPE
jgi:hypothetical protein